ncbi:nitroreductase family protein [Cetobacterium sp. SF1]|uniref:nitroreductase family protein n=1 Tax=Cetobacterium sp. SF1 TaxID=3417654 RepID=UPI003CF9F902
MLKATDIIKDHRCIRKYLKEEISEEILEEIISSVQRMPNSLNGQQTSIIIVKNSEKKSQLSALCGNQPWIDEAPVFLIFIADFFKTHEALRHEGIHHIIERSAEGLLAATLDTGIILGATIIAAESFGLGVVPIGGIRNNPEEVIKLLKLPPKTFPLCGLAMGYPADPSKKKPRLPLNTFLYEEEYNRKIINEELEKYNIIMEKYLESINRANEKNWTSFLGRFYKYIYYPNVHPALISQGFKMNC